MRGAVENVYASLVVLLGYTNTFIRTHQWQNQAQYEMGEGETCGFLQTDYRDGEVEFVLYYAEQTPNLFTLPSVACSSVSLAATSWTFPVTNLSNVTNANRTWRVPWS